MNKYSEAQMKAFGERNRSIVRDYQRGMSVRAVGEAHGVTGERVHQILTAAGVERRTRSRSPYYWAGKVMAPLPPRLTWREEIAERLRELREAKQ